MVKEITIKEIQKDVKVKYDGDKLQLSVELAKKIEEFWQDFNKDGRFFNGEIYSLATIDESEQLIEFEMKRSNFAHYLYSKHHRALPREDACRIAFTSALLVTKDQQLVLGRMNHNTANPGLIQCVGGNLDDHDLVACEFQLSASIAREVAEEIGIEVQPPQPIYLKTDQQLLETAIIFWLELDYTKAELLEIFDAHQQQQLDRNEIPELSEILFVENTAEAVLAFCEANREQLFDFIEPLLRFVVTMQ